MAPNSRTGLNLLGNELPYEYITCSFDWADSLEVKVVGQLKGRLRLDSLEYHLLKRPTGLDFAKLRQCNAIFQVKYCNSLLSSLVRGSHRLTWLGLRAHTRSPLARSWNGRGRLDLLITGHFSIAKGFPHHGVTDTYCVWSMVIGFYKVPGTEPI